MNESSPNKPDAANPAMALLLTIEDQWRRVADLGRSAAVDRDQKGEYEYAISSL
jgi:hypothetical protein